MKDNDRSGPKLTADVTAVMAAARKRRVPEIDLSNDLATMDLADGRDLRRTRLADTNHLRPIDLDTSKNPVVTGGAGLVAPLRRGRSLDCRRWVLSRGRFWPSSAAYAGARRPVSQIVRFML
jgi:hypothetical protein